MSKIPYTFIPIPKFFFKSGILDHKKKNFHKRLHFITLTFSRCQAVPHMQDGIAYNAFEFSYSAQEIAKEMGITVDEAEALVVYFCKTLTLVKLPNQVRNRPNRYLWDVAKFADDKIVDIQTASEVLEEKNRNQIREENQEKIGTEPKKSEPKSEPNRNQIREENQKKSEPNRNQIPPSLRTNKNKESLCLKETSKEKETESNQNVGQDLSLSHGEKDLFIAAKENELAEHQQALEAYVSYRNISNITPKTIARWLRTYPIDDIKDAIGLMLEPGKKRVENSGGWIESVLQNGIVIKERIKKQNIQFAKQIQTKNKHLFIGAQYCRDRRFKEKEFYYHMNPEIFQTELRKCL